MFTRTITTKTLHAHHFNFNFSCPNNDVLTGAIFSLGNWFICVGFKNIKTYKNVVVLLKFVSTFRLWLLGNSHIYSIYASVLKELKLWRNFIFFLSLIFKYYCIIYGRYCYIFISLLLMSRSHVPILLSSKYRPKNHFPFIGINVHLLECLPYNFKI